MLAKVLSSAVIGIEGYAVEVQVDIGNGLPAFNIVGLPDMACRESADRVRAAIKNSGIIFPAKKITINLAPANLKKEGSAFDLAIAIGILVANENIPHQAAEQKVFCGELSLDGKLRAISGVLPRAVFLHSTKSRADFFVPADNSKEAQCVEGLKIFSVKSLGNLIGHLKGEALIVPEKTVSFQIREPDASSGFVSFDFSDIKGQSHAKRGLEIAAAGGHNVLMIGPPGSGKTMLAKRVSTILSDLTFEESIESTKIHSVAGLLSNQSSLLNERPFRDPHHTISEVAMVGGGSHPKPGEVSLSHHGVLFLDELAEFRRGVLEVLRQPLEEGRVTISRAAATLTLPARFMLVAAMNPCPCGYFTDPKKECSCSSVQIKRYLSKVSGPLLDRIDIQLEVPRLKVVEIMGREKTEPSGTIKKRVESARQTQRARYRARKIRCNAELEARDLEKYCAVSAEGEALLKMAIQELGFSARAYHKCLKVARTIADLEGAGAIGPAHVSESIHYRSLDRTQGII
jgi:magnesium chelatase family protein